MDNELTALTTIFTEFLLLDDSSSHVFNSRGILYV